MWNLLGSYFGDTARPASQFTVLPINVHKAIAAGDTSAFYITTANPNPVKMQYSPGQGPLQGTIYKSDGVIDFVQGTVNAYPFGAFIGPRVLNVRIYYTTKAGIKYLWNTGDTTSTIITNPATDSVYSVFVFDTSGCKNFDTVSVTLKPTPTVNAGNDAAICIGETRQLNATSSSTHIAWTPSTGLNNDTILNPVFNYNQSVQYQLIATDTNGCSKRDTIDVTVHPLPTVDAGLDTALCIGTPYSLSGSSTADTVLWSPSSGIDDPHILTPVFTSNVSMLYILSVTDSFNCKNQDTVSVKVGIAPTLYAGPDTLICGEGGYVFPASTNGINIQWNPAAGLSDASVINPVFSGAQGDVYVLYATDSVGCSKTDSVTIQVHSLPIVDAGIDTTLCPATPYTMQASSDASIYLWTPSTGLDNPSLLNPAFSSFETVKYILIVTDTAGCKNSDSVIITADCPVYLKIPQAFTPNGDGHNDHFTLFGQNLTVFEIKIYNRWGELVYSSTDLTELNDLTRGWDGTYKGKTQELGTFVYYTHAIDVFGKQIEQKGNLTLIR